MCRLESTLRVLAVFLAASVGFGAFATDPDKDPHMVKLLGRHDI